MLVSDVLSKKIIVIKKTPERHFTCIYRQDELIVYTLVCIYWSLSFMYDVMEAHSKSHSGQAVEQNKRDLKRLDMNNSTGYKSRLSKHT